MNKLKYEHAVAESSGSGGGGGGGGGRGVVRPNAAAAIAARLNKTKSTCEKSEKVKRTTTGGGGVAPRPAAAADRRRAASVVLPSTAHGRRPGDEGPRDPAAASSAETSGCKSNVHAATPVKPRVKRTISNTTGIPMRQEKCSEKDSVVRNSNSRKTPIMVKSNTGSELFSLFEKIGKTPAPSDFKGFTENPIRDDSSQEGVTSKSTKTKHNVCPDARASCPAPTFNFKSKTKKSNSSPADCHNDVQDNRLDDEPANSIYNESMDQLPQVDTNCYSNEVHNENSDFDTVELMKNDASESSDEHVDEDTPRVLETSDVTLIGECELNDEFVTSCLEAESIAQLEKHEDPVVLELPKESPEYNESQPPSSNGAVPVFDSDQEKNDEHVDENTPRALETSDATLIGERELKDVLEVETSSLEAESIVLSKKHEDPVVLELPKESPEYNESLPPSLNATVPVLDSNQGKAESIKSLCAHFEALLNRPPDDKPTPKASRKSNRLIHEKS